MYRLLDTKLQPPRLRDDRVRRPHLYEQLTDFTGAVVVSAPPGFGKSTFIADWLLTHDRPSTWYTIDRYDDDPGLFGEYLASAVASLVGSTRPIVSLPGDPPFDARTMIAMIADDLGGAPDGAVIVLDDYHEIRSPQVHEAVDYLLENLPDKMTIALVSRSDPPLALARLRASGRLVDIRGADLRFSAGDIEAFYASASGITLGPSQVAAIADRSEGWVAALQLARIGVGTDDPDALVDALSARRPHIAGYLLEEVLGRLPPDTTTFLLESSTFDRFDDDLLRDILGTHDPGAVVSDLDRANAFVIPLGDGWYRYHHLFSDLLRARLARSDPDRQLSITAEAATVCDQRGLPDDAIAYALRAGDLAGAGAIAQRHGRLALGNGQVARMRSWLMRFPADAGPATLVVTLGWAWCRIFEGDHEAATHLLDRIEAERGPTDPPVAAQVAIMRAIVAFQRGDPVGAEEHARNGLAMLERPSPYLDCLGELYVGRSLHARAMRSEAKPHLERAASLAGAGNTMAAVNALFWLGVIDGDTGDLVAAERTMVRAGEVAARDAAGLRAEGPAVGLADVGLAFMRLNQLEPADAARLAEHGCHLLERTTSIDMMFRAFFVWTESLSLAGEWARADDVAEDGIAWLRGRHMGGGPLEAWLWLSQTRNQWRQGRLAAAEELLDRVLGRGLGGANDDETAGFYEAAASLSLALRLGDTENCVALLDALPPGTSGNVMFAIERNVLAGAVHEVRGERRAAAAALEEAVGLAASGYRYQFSHVGPVIRPTLLRMVGRSTNDAFVRSILDRLPLEADSTPDSPVASLTDRELDVLAEIAAGYTNDEIADRLYIAQGTVKRHAANIYLKLNVRHRAEAAARGRELGLID